MARKGRTAHDRPRPLPKITKDGEAAKFYTGHGVVSRAEVLRMKEKLATSDGDGAHKLLEPTSSGTFATGSFALHVQRGFTVAPAKVPKLGLQGLRCAGPSSPRSFSLEGNRIVDGYWRQESTGPIDVDSSPRTPGPEDNVLLLGDPERSHTEFLTLSDSPIADEANQRPQTARPSAAADKTEQKRTAIHGAWAPTTRHRPALMRDCHTARIPSSPRTHSPGPDIKPSARGASLHPGRRLRPATAGSLHQAPFKHPPNSVHGAHNSVDETFGEVAGWGGTPISSPLGSPCSRVTNSKVAPDRGEDDVLPQIVVRSMFSQADIEMQRQITRDRIHSPRSVKKSLESLRELEDQLSNMDRKVLEGYREMASPRQDGPIAVLHDNRNDVIHVPSSPLRSDSTDSGPMKIQSYSQRPIVVQEPTEFIMEGLDDMTNWREKKVASRPSSASRPQSVSRPLSARVASRHGHDIGLFSGDAQNGELQRSDAVSLSPIIIVKRIQVENGRALQQMLDDESRLYGLDTDAGTYHGETLSEQNHSIVPHKREDATHSAFSIEITEKQPGNFMQTEELSPDDFLVINSDTSVPTGLASRSQSASQRSATSSRPNSAHRISSHEVGLPALIASEQGLESVQFQSEQDTKQYPKWQQQQAALEDVTEEGVLTDECTPKRVDASFERDKSDMPEMLIKEDANSHKAVLGTSPCVQNQMGFICPSCNRSVQIRSVGVKQPVDSQSCEQTSQDTLQEAAESSASEAELKSLREKLAATEQALAAAKMTAETPNSELPPTANTTASWFGESAPPTSMTSSRLTSGTSLLTNTATGAKSVAKSQTSFARTGSTSSIASGVSAADLQGMLETLDSLKSQLSLSSSGAAAAADRHKQEMDTKNAELEALRQETRQQEQDRVEKHEIELKKMKEALAKVKFEAAALRKQRDAKLAIHERQALKEGQDRLAEDRARIASDQDRLDADLAAARKEIEDGQRVEALRKSLETREKDLDTQEAQIKQEWQRLHMRQEELSSELELTVGDVKHDKAALLRELRLHLTENALLSEEVVSLEKELARWGGGSRPQSAKPTRPSSTTAMMSLPHPSVSSSSSSFGIAPVLTQLPAVSTDGDDGKDQGQARTMTLMY